MPDNVAVELSVTLAGFEELSQRAPLRWHAGNTLGARASCSPISVGDRLSSRAGRPPSQIVACKLSPPVPAALAAGNKRWERGHPVLLEGWKPSFPALFHASCHPPFRRRWPQGTSGGYGRVASSGIKEAALGARPSYAVVRRRPNASLARTVIGVLTLAARPWPRPRMQE